MDECRVVGLVYGLRVAQKPFRVHTKCVCIYQLVCGVCLAERLWNNTEYVAIGAVNSVAAKLFISSPLVRALTSNNTRDSTVPLEIEFSNVPTYAFSRSSRNARTRHIYVPTQSDATRNLGTVMSPPTPSPSRYFSRIK